MCAKKRICSSKSRRKQPLSQRLMIAAGDTVSFIGSGGKTTSIMQTARELADCGLRVAVTTTTKMGLNEKDLLPDSVYFCAEAGGGKYCAPPDNTIEELSRTSDAVLIEADGSKRRAVKGWNSTEPVIHPCTTKTVGIISVRSVGKPVNERYVHRPEQFIRISSAKPNRPLRLSHIMQAVFHPEGLFCKARGICFVLCIAPRSEHEKIRTAYYRARGRRFGKRGSCSNPYLRFSCPCIGNGTSYCDPPHRCL